MIIPNVFSPNGDGDNDLFIVENVPGTDYRFNLFNRWGNEVFAYHGDRVVWNGRNNDQEELPDGVYFYELERVRAGRSERVAGYVQLLRGR